MLFNSYLFIFVFAPVVIGGFHLVKNRFSPKAGHTWLLVASLIFYAWGEPYYVVILIASLTVNFILGESIDRAKQSSSPRLARVVFVAGVSMNLGLLAFFKYANFILENVGAVTPVEFSALDIALPLGISFYTFQKVAYLADRYYSVQVIRPSFVDYALFVSFFPQLIAGPIVHHAEFLPQLHRQQRADQAALNMAAGLTMFILGLAKKTVIADTVAQWASPVYAAAARGETITLLDGWAGALAYSFQIYFDFSAYSDMAVGLGLMCGLVLPINFNSPYKARSIIEFWRCWHMTLSRFLRDYLYIPLGGNRKGRARRYINLMITMAIGGLWHGAAWTFVIWGGMHGLLLAVNHAWRRYVPLRGRALLSGRMGDTLARLLTFVSVTVAWVFFRSDNMTAVEEMLRAMGGLNGLVLPIAYEASLAKIGLGAGDHGIRYAVLPYFHGATEIIVLFILLMIVWYAPNTQQIVLRRDKAAMPPIADDPLLFGGGILRWRPSRAWGAVVGVVGALSILGLSQISEFIYFRF